MVGCVLVFKQHGAIRIENNGIGMPLDTE